MLALENCYRVFCGLSTSTRLNLAVSWWKEVSHPHWPSHDITKAKFKGGCAAIKVKYAVHTVCTIAMAGLSVLYVHSVGQ